MILENEDFLIVSMLLRGNASHRRISVLESDNSLVLARLFRFHAPTTGLVKMGELIRHLSGGGYPNAYGLAMMMPPPLWTCNARARWGIPKLCNHP